jgi:hypothetical protein
MPMPVPMPAEEDEDDAPAGRAEVGLSLRAALFADEEEADGGLPDDEEEDANGVTR